MRKSARLVNLGVRQRYVHANPFHLNAVAFNSLPAPFTQPSGVRRAPVTGGRWQVRKLAAVQVDGRYWHAYTRGTARAMSERFHTQEEAFAWCCTVLTAIYEGGPHVRL